NPLRVAWVDFDAVPGYRDLSGRLGMTFLPGKKRDGWGGLHWRTLATDLNVLKVEHRADVFFLLVEDVELEMARVSGLEEAFERHDIELIRFPISDEAIPTDRSAYRAAL